MMMAVAELLTKRLLSYLIKLLIMVLKDKATSPFTFVLKEFYNFLKSQLSLNGPWRSPYSVMVLLIPFFIGFLTKNT